MSGGCGYCVAREALRALLDEHTDCPSCDACEPTRRLLNSDAKACEGCRFRAALAEVALRCNEHRERENNTRGSLVNRLFQVGSIASEALRDA